MALTLTLLLFGAITSVGQVRYWEVLTLFGGNGYETYPSAFLYDAKRDRFIVTGSTREQDLPVTPDAYKTRLTDMMDGFIAVFNGDCSELIYCSYLGGSYNDAIIDAVILDENRFLVAVGSYSKDLPTSGRVLFEEAPGQHNGWLAILSMETYQILGAGYFGGSAEDTIERVFKLKDGNIVLTGWATSRDLPVTPTAFQSKNNSISGHRDAYIAIFDSTLELTFCSYHGGRIGDGEDAWKGLVETENFIVFTGTVLSPDLPITGDAYQNTYGGGVLDAYLTVISKDSLKRVYSTYLGGDGNDHIAELVSLGGDRVMLVGTTQSMDFPITPNAWQRANADTTLPWGRGEIIFGVFSIVDRRFEQLSYIGGTDYEFAKTAVYDILKQEIFILGVSFSNDFPLLTRKPEDCLSRGVLIRLDSDSLIPTSIQPVVDVGKSYLDCLIYLPDGQLAFCGTADNFSEASPVPVRPSGFKTRRTGSSDVMIGLIHDAPVSVVTRADVPPLVGRLDIRPQPAKDALRFEFEGEGEGTAYLIDLLGRSVAVSQLNSWGGVVRGRMGLATVESGMYFLVVRMGDVVHTGKVVVAK